MRQHKNAALSIAQRIEIKRLYQRENKAVSQLALTYRVSEATIRKWIKRESPFDLPSTAHHLPGVITEPYRQAVLDYRKDHPIMARFVSLTNSNKTTRLPTGVRCLRFSNKSS
jgi:transposase-like protein